MDVHIQLQKNMEELAAVFETRMQRFNSDLLAHASTSSSSSKSPSAGTSKDLATLASEFSTFRDIMWRMLAMLREQLQLLTSALDEQEMRSRRKVLLLHGVQEKSDEQIIHLIHGVVRDRLQLSDFQISDIDVGHRIGAKKDKPRPILVRFKYLQAKTKVWASKTQLKGSGITITEFLTKPRQELFVAARKYFGMKSCWTADGFICIALPDKSRRKITSRPELNSLITKFPQAGSIQGHDQPTPQPQQAKRRPIKTSAK